MLDILNKYIIEHLVYVQLIPVLIGFICYKKLDKIYQIFIWVLLYSALNEIFKIYYGNYIHKDHNIIWTNIYNIIYFSFLFLVFSKKSRIRFKKVIRFILILYFISLFYEFFIINVNYHEKHQVIPFVIGGLGIILCVFNYLYRQVNSEHEIKIYNDFMFWFVAAHFIYFLAFTPLKIGENHFVQIKEFYNLFNIKIGATILKILLLSIGFLWTTYNKDN